MLLLKAETSEFRSNFFSVAIFIDVISLKMRMSMCHLKEVTAQLRNPTKKYIIEENVSVKKRREKREGERQLNFLFLNE